MYELQTYLKIFKKPEDTCVGTLVVIKRHWLLLRSKLPKRVAHLTTSLKGICMVVFCTL